jgi:hypothetical protein
MPGKLFSLREMATQPTVKFCQQRRLPARQAGQEEAALQGFHRKLSQSQRRWVLVSLLVCMVPSSERSQSSHRTQLSGPTWQRSLPLCCWSIAMARRQLKQLERLVWVVMESQHWARTSLRKCGRMSSVQWFSGSCCSARCARAPGRADALHGRNTRCEETVSPVAGAHQQIFPKSLPQWSLPFPCKKVQEDLQQWVGTALCSATMEGR